MTTFIKHLTDTFTDTGMSKLVRDKVIAAGTRLLFDFKDSYCNQNPDGALALGNTFLNMVDGAPSAVIGGSSANAFVNNSDTTGGILAPGAAAVGHIISLGSTYSLHATDPSFIALAWIKCPASAITTANQAIFQLIGANNQNTLFSMDTGANGKSPRVMANNHNNVPSTYRDIVGFTTDAVHQIGVAWRPGFCDVIFNGAIITTFVNVNADLLDLSAFNMTALTTRQSTTMYRLLLEDLTISGRTVAQAAVADFAAATGRFS